MATSRSVVSLLGLTNRRPFADGQQYEYGEDLGVTAVALYDYQAGETEPVSFCVPAATAFSHTRI